MRFKKYPKCQRCGCDLSMDDHTCPVCDVDKNYEYKQISLLKEDIINKPKHYNFANIEPIDVIEDWKLDFRLANALKYISRAGKKDIAKTKEDLQKAIWYINRYIIKECPDDEQTE